MDNSYVTTLNEYGAKRLENMSFRDWMTEATVYWDGDKSHIICIHTDDDLIVSDTGEYLPEGVFVVLKSFNRYKDGTTDADIGGPYVKPSINGMERAKSVNMDVFAMYHEYASTCSKYGVNFESLTPDQLNVIREELHLPRVYDDMTDYVKRNVMSVDDISVYQYVDNPTIMRAFLTTHGSTMIKDYPDAKYLDEGTLVSALLLEVKDGSVKSYPGQAVPSVLSTEGMTPYIASENEISGIYRRMCEKYGIESKDAQKGLSDELKDKLNREIDFQFETDDNNVSYEEYL